MHIYERELSTKRPSPLWFSLNTQGSRALPFRSAPSRSKRAMRMGRRAATSACLTFAARTIRDQGRLRLSAIGSVAGSSKRFKIEFETIPGCPLAYWMTENVRNAFKIGTALGDISCPRKGNSTSDNNRFLRFWPEVSFANIGLKLSAYSSEFRWIPYNKGGGFLKWYGHNSYLIDWQDQGRAIREIPTAVIANEALFFQPGLTWGTVTSKYFSIRWFEEGRAIASESYEILLEQS